LKSNPILPVSDMTVKLGDGLLPTAPVAQL
jgi:hypothetical protein